MKKLFKFFITLILFVSLTFILSNINIVNNVVPNLPAINLNPKEENSNCSDKEEIIKSYLKRYPFFLECKNPYGVWSPKGNNFIEMYDYTKPADEKLHDLRIIRALIIYFPIDKIDHFKLEFLWLYRSWLDMLRYEPAKWRTDLIFFTRNDPKILSKTDLFVNSNCSFENLRQSPNDKPMCTLINYEPINSRNFSTKSRYFEEDPKNYEFFFNKFDIFTNDEPKGNEEFYKFIQEGIVGYNYIDSILMAFDGYAYFKKAGYDFLVRSDMDVFLPPPFATWLPRYCNDFYVGRGGYSSNFNSNRFKRIASNLGLSYSESNNLGSTWYSTPAQFRLVSYLTLLGMTYLNNEEFAEPERQQKLGTLMWPDWHYGVLLLYGQHLTLNHLIGSKQVNAIMLWDQLDYPSGNNHSIYNMLHIHVFHGEVMFSKFMFKMGRYNNITLDMIDEEKSNLVSWFALKMSIEGRDATKLQFSQLYSNATSNKL